MKQTKPTPPRFAQLLLHTFISDDLAEEVTGDLNEQFYDEVKKISTFRAKLNYYYQVFHYLRPFAFKKNWIHHLISNDMIFNNIRMALRALIKQKGYSFISLLGLVIGITGFLMISLFVQYEMSFDQDFKDADRIYKLVLERKYPDKTSITPYIPHSFSKVIAADYGEVEQTSSIVGPFDDMMISYKGKNNTDVKVLEQAVYAADSNFFQMLSFNLVQGDRNTLLKAPRSMVLTQSAAKRHFGNDDPLGKLITMSGDQFLVTGVCEDPPANTHFNFGIIISIHTIERFNLKNFVKPDVHCYLRLNAGANPDALQSKFPKMVETYAAAEVERIDKISWADYKKAGNGYYYTIHPLTSIYLDPDNLGRMKTGGNLIFIQVLIVTAGFLLLISCVNFINLATARAMERAKEVGIRKMLGSVRLQLISKFLCESFLLSFIGVACAVVVLVYTIPSFNLLVERELVVPFNTQSVFVFVGLAIAIGLLAGIYPSLALSSYRPLTVLKPSTNPKSERMWLRNSLVVFQFWISIVLIISAIVMKDQVYYLANKDLGYNKNQLLVIDGDFHMKPKFTSRFISEIKRLPTVDDAAGSLSMPSIDGIWSQQYRLEGSPEIISMKAMTVGDEFCEVMDFKLQSGRLFSVRTNDSLSVVVNESAVKILGSGDPIGKKITRIEQSYGTGEETVFTIIGVIKDFNYETLHNQIQPLIIESNEIIYNRVGYIIVRIKPDTNAETLLALESKWKELASDLPFQFRFVDQVVNSQYGNEISTNKIFSLFSGLSILVGCIGLFGLATYSVGSRAKEIAIRKVMGATPDRILLLLSGDVTKILLISYCLAIPTAWILMEKWWLEHFAFRIHVEVLILFLTGVGVLLLGWMTVGYQTVKAAIQNPVKSLRSE